LRVLCLQTDIADQTLDMLHGALQELRIGRPDRLATDVGPVIDAEAQQDLQAYVEQARFAGKVRQLPLPPAVARGTFVAPAIIEIDSMAALQREVFGPVLHVLRYRRDELPQLVAAINATGYGLTLGVHSRIDETVDAIVGRARVGNVYVNRNIVGAVVGVQPFGGEGQSGTGPKAGGPLYLKRLQRKAVEALDAQSLKGEIDAQARPGAGPAIAALLSWSETHGHRQLSVLGRAYVRDSLYGRTLDLPGPTGESNTLHFAARGAVLCVAGGTPALLNQLAAVLATGNRAVLLQAAAAHLPLSLPQPVLACIRIVERHQDCDELALALHDRSAAGGADLLATLAARDGAIVPTLATDADAPVALWRLVAERAVCVNTTAAGGNASLMAMREQ
jgi:RHH-type proline utilization regulon transcriptional repressor/proline dehydrogenase/delta 1-pyrroline-5-carboxylate dehydrogenase